MSTSCSLTDWFGLIRNTSEIRKKKKGILSLNCFCPIFGQSLLHVFTTFLASSPGHYHFFNDVWLATLYSDYVKW